MRQRMITRLLVVAAAMVPLALWAQSQKPSVKTVPPVVVKTVPEAGSTSVDPATTEIRVTFSKPMQDGSWSWLHQENHPDTVGQPRYLADLFDREAPTPPRSRGRFVPDPLLVALPILGAWLVAWALPELASGIALSVISRGGTQSVRGPIPYTADEQAMVWSATRKANEVGALVAGLVGLVLLLRTEQIAALLARVKLGPAEENGAEEEAEGSAPTQDEAEREPRTGRGEQQQ